MSNPFRRPSSLIAGSFVALLGLSACNGVGSGNSLEQIHIVPAVSNPTLAYLKEAPAEAPAYQCIQSALDLVATFSQSDDDLALFTSRATWSSSNPAIVKVSNGDEPNPLNDAFMLAKGILLPIAPGSAVITASYLDLQASITVDVSSTGGFRIEPADPHVALNSVRVLQLLTTIDGEDIDVSSNAQASFQVENDDVARLSLAATGAPLVTGWGVGEPMNLDMTLPVCGQTYTATVRVAEPVSLALTHEDGFSGDLVVGNNERIKVMADFGEGPEQDLTSQSTLNRNTDDTTASSRIAFTNPFVRSIATGNAVPVNATCCVLNRNAEEEGSTPDTTDEGEGAAYTSNDLVFSPVAGDLTSFTIDPVDPTLEQGDSLQFKAIGTFDGGVRTQPVTRLVLWTSAATSIGYFTANSSLSTLTGTVYANVDSSITENRTVTLTATPSTTIDGSTTTTPITTTLTVTPPASEETTAP